ncbi:MAG: hypothetical protein AAGE52_00085 [Myxococcota bacterium]
MEIFLGRRAVRQVRLSATDAIDDGDTETLREDLIDVFTQDQVELIERHIDSGDIYEFVSEVLDEWGGDDVDELFELLEGQLSDADLELKFPTLMEEDDESDDDRLDDLDDLADETDEDEDDL